MVHLRKGCQEDRRRRWLGRRLDARPFRLGVQALHKDLAAAYRQLLDYRYLENPPLLVVCDLDRFEIHTNFTNTRKRVYAFDLEGLASRPTSTS